MDNESGGEEGVPIESPPEFVVEIGEVGNCAGSDSIPFLLSGLQIGPAAR